MAKRQHRRPRASPALVLKVTGRDIRPGRIPIRDLVVICAQAQSAIDRQAEAIEGKRTLRPGPTTEKIRQECTLELVALRKGSALLAFEHAKPQPTLPVVQALGFDAVTRVTQAIAALAEGNDVEVDPGVLDSLNKMGELLNNGIDAVEWSVPSRGGRRLRAKLTKEVQRRVAARLKPPVEKAYSGDGLLEMADFNPAEHKCRIHPPLGAPVTCTFDPSLADEIYGVLRQPVHVEGKASINAETQRIENVNITRVKPLDPLTINAGNFFRGWTFEQLIHTQAVMPVRDLKALSGVWPLDDDIDAALAEIYQHRD